MSARPSRYTDPEGHARWQEERAKAQAEMAADERFLMTHRLELVTAMQQADWPTAARLARQVADPASGVSKSLRLEVLVQVSWSMLTHEKADKAYVKDALQLAKAAYDLGRENALVVDTYARALFEDGRIQDAIEHQRQAIELADEAGGEKPREPEFGGPAPEHDQRAADDQELNVEPARRVAPRREPEHLGHRRTDRTPRSDQEERPHHSREQDRREERAAAGVDERREPQADQVTHERRK